MGEIRPYICTNDARAAIDWYVESMGAEVTDDPIVMDDGRIGHVELSFGGAPLMMSDAYPDLHVEAPAEGRGAAVTLYLTADDVDALASRAVDGRSHARPRTRGQRPRADGGVPRPVRPPLDARQHRLRPSRAVVCWPEASRTPPVLQENGLRPSPGSSLEHGR